MLIKDLVSQVAMTLSNDPDILSLLEITKPTSTLVNDRISRTKQLTNIADEFTRLCVWEEAPVPTSNPRVNQHALVVTIFSTRDKQNRTGVCFDLQKNIKEVVLALEDSLRTRGTPIGTGITKVMEASNLRTAYGWFKAEVRFEYKNIE